MHLLKNIDVQWTFTLYANLHYIGSHNNIASLYILQYLQVVRFLQSTDKEISQVCIYVYSYPPQHLTSHFQHQGRSPAKVRS